MSLRTRLTLAGGGAVFVALAVASLVIYVDVRSKLRDQIDFSLIQSAESVAVKWHSNATLAFSKDASGFFQVVPSLGDVTNAGLSATGAPVRTAAAATTAASSATLAPKAAEEQILGELREPVRLAADRTDGGLELVPSARGLERQLDLGLQVRERSPELVACVGDEAPLPLERRLQAPEHRVQRLSEAVELVPRLRQRQLLAGAVAGDPRRPPPHRLDRSQGGPGQGVATGRGQRKQQREPDEHLLAHPTERLEPVLAGVADDEHQGPAMTGERRREEACRLVEARRAAAVDGDRRPGGAGSFPGREERPVVQRGRCL